jgi:hypothetical protein
VYVVLVFALSVAVNVLIGMLDVYNICTMRFSEIGTSRAAGRSVGRSIFTFSSNSSRVSPSYLKILGVMTTRYIVFLITRHSA